MAESSQWRTVRNVNSAVACDYRRLPAGIGPVPCAIGTVFPSRDAASIVHHMTQAGIAGTEHGGCGAICVNGGYADDVDNGFRVIYTGSSGTETGVKMSLASHAALNVDQRWSEGNKSLRTSMARPWPVRVLRGPKCLTEWADEKGYRYDGLYMVRKCWIARGKTGVKIIHFAMERMHDQGPLFVNGKTIDPPDYDNDREYHGDWPILNDDHEVQRPVRASEPFANIDPSKIYIKAVRAEIQPLARGKPEKKRGRKHEDEHHDRDLNPPRREPNMAAGRQSQSPTRKKMASRRNSVSPPLPRRRPKPIDKFAAARQF